MSDPRQRISAMTLEEMWAESRKRTGRCHFCSTPLRFNEDKTICDTCWKSLNDENDQEED